jgi:predicted metal-dependent HD superfamily phosphohydrolase
MNNLNLKQEWQNLVGQFGVVQPDAETVFEELAAQYRLSNRHYHDLEHIAQVLQIIEEFSAEAHQLVAVKLAAWFHDVVYDPKANDNEVQSADYAQKVLQI